MRVRLSQSTAGLSLYSGSMQMLGRLSLWVGGVTTAYMGGAFVKCWLTSLLVGGVNADEPTFAWSMYLCQLEL